MLCASVLNYGSNWEKCLPYAEFSYNNSYQASIKMSPFEALFGRPCKTPLMWSQPGERSFFDSAKIQDAEEGVAQVKENLRIAQSRYKSYADKRRRELEFNVGSQNLAKSRMTEFMILVFVYPALEPCISPTRPN